MQLLLLDLDGTVRELIYLLIREQEEYRSSGVQEFRILLKERTCLEIGATSQASNAYNSPLKLFQWLP
jgi:hypothetical protein